MLEIGYEPLVASYLTVGILIGYSLVNIGEQLRSNRNTLFVALLIGVCIALVSSLFVQIEPLYPVFANPIVGVILLTVAVGTSLLTGYNNKKQPNETKL